MGTESDTSDRRCPACSERLTAERAVPLWDGRVYCRRCVECACPELADYAASHERLQESMPLKFCEEHNRRLARIMAGSLGVFSIVLCATALPSGEYPFVGVLIALFMALFVGVPVCVLFYLFSVSLVRNKRPYVCVQSGRLTVRYGESEVNAALRDCQWWFGKLKGMHLFREHHIYSRAPVLLIRFPRGGFWGRAPVIVAVGYTPEMRGLWEGFLRLADVRKRR